MSTSLTNQGVLMDTVLQAIAEGHSIKTACSKAGCNVGSHYFWLKNDPSYVEGYKFALRIQAENVVLPEIQRRAVHGVTECKTFVEVHPDPNNPGQYIEIVTGKTYHTKFPDAPLIAVAKAQLPELFTDRKQVEITDNTTVADTLAAARRRLAASREKDEPGERDN